MKIQIDSEIVKCKKQDDTAKINLRPSHSEKINAMQKLIDEAIESGPGSQSLEELLAIARNRYTER